MSNKVVTTIAKVMLDLSLPCLRFNFRGVGQSEGQFDNGQGESDDLLELIDWMRQQFPDFSLCLTGFSFGSYVAYKTATRLSPSVDLNQISVGF